MKDIPNCFSSRGMEIANIPFLIGVFVFSFCVLCSVFRTCQTFQSFRIPKPGCNVFCIGTRFRRIPEHRKPKTENKKFHSNGKSVISDSPRCFLIALSLTALCLPVGALAQEEGMEDLDVSLGELLNLEITVATKTEVTLQEAPSIVSVITGNEIRNMGARDIYDILKTIPGVNTSPIVSVPYQEIFIRGFSSEAESKKIKILIDGHSVTYFGGGSSFIAPIIPIRNIRQVEIIRGPGSALYGTGAFIGVVNIVTKKGGDESSKIAWEGGSFDTFRPYGELSYKDDDFKTYLYAEHYHTDGYKGIVDSDFATNNPGFLAGHAPGELTGEVDYYTAHTNISYKNLEFSGYFAELRENNPLGITYCLTDNNELNHQYAFGELRYKQPVSEELDILFKASYDHSHFEMYHELWPPETGEIGLHTGFPEGRGFMGSPHMKQSIASGEISADYRAFKGFQVIAGATYAYTKFYDVESYANYNLTGGIFEVDGVEYPPFPWRHFPEGLTNISENGNWSKETDRTVSALYGQCIIDFKDMLGLDKGVESLSLTMGARYDNYDDFGSTANPRFGLVYAPLKSLYFKALYGTAFRAPNFSDMYSKNNPAVVGNEDLEPEEIETLEFLVGYNFTDNITSSLTWFNVKAKELIRTAASENGAVTYVNTGEMESSGIEAEVKLHFEKQKYVYANLAWQDVKDTTNATIAGADGLTQGDFFPGSVPEIYGNIGFNYDVCKYMLANVGVNYLGKRKRSEEKMWDGEALVQADRRDDLDSRILVNASMTFLNFIRGLELQLTCHNILDEENRDPEVTGALQNDMPMPGRTYMARISCSF